ncbi:MAG: hypothetical protein PHY45_00260 [Rhodocyclaceae bacterium]|nr:hypothetical protein [Rhodocyclaceae bacterium]
MADYEVITANDDLEGPRAWCHVMYGLHALSAVGGLLTSATIVGAFITGWPSILAVIINYATRSRVTASWLESHWRWQLRTFWFAVLWATLAMLLFFSVLGIPLAWGLIVGTGLWLLYRVTRGWLVLLDRKAIA